MNDDSLFSFGNPWFRAGIGATIVAFVVSALIGFVWLPSAKSDSYFQGVWNAICSAAGVPRQWHPVESAIAPGYKTSTVELTPHMLDHPTSLSIGRGATLATMVKLWTTPSARDWKGAPSSAETMPTNSRPLNEVVRLFPTPMARDAHNRSGQAKRYNEQGRVNLQDRMAADGVHGSLNPEFVAWLMGYPPEWLSCAPSAMPSSRRLSRKSGERS